MFELPSLPQEMGEIVIQGLRLGRLAYRRLFNLTTMIAFLSLIPTVVQVWGKGDDVSFEAPVFNDWNMVAAWLRQFYGSYGAALLVTGGLALFPQTLLLRRIALAARGQKETPREELRQALRLWPWAMLTGLVYVVVVGFGFMLIVPGLILGVSLMFSVYATVLDGMKPLPALNGSHHLVWGHWWRTLGLVLVLYIPFMLLGMMLSTMLGFDLDPGQALHARDLFKQAVLDMVLVAFLAPFMFSIQYLYYRDLKLRRQVP
ncbi:MAG TPA: hypothetical protein VGM16_00710 [Gammaproteobacteria bacterium]